MLSAFASRYGTHSESLRWEPCGKEGGLSTGDQVLPLNTKRASLVGRGWGWWEVWRLFFAGGCKVTQWVEVCVGCQMSGSFYLASLYTPGSSWKPACLYLPLFNEARLNYLEDVKLLRMEGMGLYTLLYFEAHFLFRLLEFGPPPVPKQPEKMWGRVFVLAVNTELTSLVSHLMRNAVDNCWRMSLFPSHLNFYLCHAHG